MDELEPSVERPDLILILDTNIWLDWLVFKDSATTKLIAAHQTGQVRILAGPQARDEFADVITRDKFGLGMAAQAACLTQFDQLARIVPPAPEHQATNLPSLLCTDPDDQQFLDLAIQTGADYLLSKDKALLKLARRARRDYRFDIVTLATWNAGQRIMPRPATV